ncbi:MAG TPA: EamA family transporter [Candidatus Baltobacteraceae bacterium]
MASLTQSLKNGTVRPASLSWIALITVWFLWGSTYLGIRVAVQTIPPFLMAGSRYLIAGSLLALILWITQRERLTPVKWSDLRSVVITAVLLLVVSNGLLSWAEVHIQSSLAALIVSGVPIWMVLLDALLYTRKIQPIAMLGMAVGSIGMVLLVGIPSGHVPIVTAVILIGGSLCWAFGSVLARRRHGHRTHPLFPALEMIVAGVLSWVVGIAAGELHGFHLSAVTLPSIGGFLWLIVMGSMVGYTAFAYMIRTLPTHVSSTYAYVNPVVAVVLGAAILHEPVTLNILAGGATIVTAVVIILLGTQTQRKEV